MIAAPLGNVGGLPHLARASGGTEWYTPRDIIEGARVAMGGIDLDPASTAEANEVIKASVFLTVLHDGLRYPWQGRVWLNPPYARSSIGHFINKLLAEHDAGHVEQACVLTNNATETRWFQLLARSAAALCLVAGRIRFWHPGHTGTGPLQGQVVFYLGTDTEAFEGAFAALGLIVRPLGSSEQDGQREPCCL